MRYIVSYFHDAASQTMVQEVEADTHINAWEQVLCLKVVTEGGFGEVQVVNSPIPGVWVFTDLKTGFNNALVNARNWVGAWTPGDIQVKLFDVG